MIHLKASIGCGLFSLIVANAVMAGTPQSYKMSEHARNGFLENDSVVPDTVVAMWQDSAWSSVRIVNIGQDSIRVITQECKYIQISYLASLSGTMGTNWDYSIIRQKIERLFGPWEGDKGRVESDFFLVDGNDFSLRKHWSIAESGDDGNVYDKAFYFTSTQYFSCPCVIYRLHRFSDGEKILTYTDRLISVYREEVKADRYVGAMNTSMSDDPAERSDSMLLATVSYLSLDSCLHKFAFRGKTGASRRRWEDNGGVCRIDRISSDTIPAIEARDRRWTFKTGSPAEDNIHLTTLEHSPTLIVPLRNDDFALDITDFGDYEVVRLK